MLCERRTCFRGRWGAMDDLRVTPPIGEPLARDKLVNDGRRTAVAEGVDSSIGLSISVSGRHVVGAEPRLPNWKAGSRMSFPVCVGMEVVECILLLVNDGRGMLNLRACVGIVRAGRGAKDRADRDCSSRPGVSICSSSSSGVACGDEGRVTRATKHGALCGSGEMSMQSMAGEEEGIGGVVAPSFSTGGVTRSPFQSVSYFIPIRFRKNSYLDPDRAGRDLWRTMNGVVSEFGD